MHLTVYMHNIKKKKKKIKLPVLAMYPFIIEITLQDKNFAHANII